jgi:hypothetical protein
MRPAWYRGPSLVAGVILLLMGTVFALQGLGVLPGSLMSGQLMWTLIGGIIDVAGIALVCAGLPRRAS